MIRQVRISSGRATLALEVTTGKTTGSGGFLAVIDRQGEEFLSRLGLGGGDGSDDDDRLTELDSDGSVGLLGQFTGFDDNALVANLGDNFLSRWLQGCNRRPRETSFSPQTGERGG